MSNPDPSTQMSYEDVQKIIRDTDNLKSQLNLFIQQSEILSHSINDLEGSLKSLAEIKSRNNDEEAILLPLGSHILVEANLKSKNSVLFDLGSNIVQELDFEDAKQKIDFRLEELKKSKQILATNIIQLRNEISSRENFLNQLVPASK